MRIRHIVFALLFLIVHVSCAQRTPTAHELSVQMTDQAMELLKRRQDNATRLRSLSLLDAAIKIDKTNFVAYNNKISILLSMKQVNDANLVLDQVNALNRDYSFVMLQGFIYERAYRDSAKAQQFYLKSFDMLDSAHKAKPDDKKIAMNRAFLTLFTKGKEQGIKAYEALADKYKNDTFILAMKSEFYDFDRSRYLNSLW